MSRAETIEIGFDRPADDRYQRLRLIPWWNQQVLEEARVMVVGAGAIGNEVLKNLALLGVGTIFVIDLDLVENSNLSRSVLFRASDEGRPKALAAAEKTREMNPGVKAIGLKADICHDVGLGLFRSVDLVIGGLDNREARLSINEKCWKVNRPWIDGATETIAGLARVFMPPGGPCYECTMNELDFRLLNMRRSCALFRRGEILEGKVPTTPTTASVVAGIQVQEAVKILHGMEGKDTLAGRGFFFNGQTHDSYVVEYRRRENCLSHRTYREIGELDLATRDTSAGRLLEIARKIHGGNAVLELEHECVHFLECRKCREREEVFSALGRMEEKRARCPGCGRVRVAGLFHAIRGGETFLDRTLDRLGIPPNDLITVKAGRKEFHYELAGDRGFLEIAENGEKKQGRV